MLGVFGILFPELLYSVGLQTAPGLTSTYDWTQVGALDYGIPNNTLLAIEFFLFAWVEGRRLQVSEREDARVATRPAYGVQIGSTAAAAGRWQRGVFAPAMREELGTGPEA